MSSIDIDSVWQDTSEKVPKWSPWRIIVVVDIDLLEQVKIAPHVDPQRRFDGEYRFFAKEAFLQRFQATTPTQVERGLNVVW